MANSSASVLRAPRVLFLPNEPDFIPANGQIGARSSFNAMVEDGIIGELKIYNFLAEFYARDKNKEKEQRAFLEVVRAYQPDILFWQHPSDYPLDVELIRQIKACGSSPLIAYHEADPYDRYYKRIHSQVRNLYAASDVFFTTGLGGARQRFSEIKVHPHFYWTPSTFDRERFGGEPADTATLGTRYDAIMIGTIAAAWKGTFKQPQSNMRVELARALAKQLGSRFAAFGRGWPTGTNCAGKIPYADQAATIRTARMSVMWDLYPDYTFYFSDRLPIALGSGVPFVVNNRPGYDALFRNCPGLFPYDTIQDAVDIAVYLKSLPIQQIFEMGEAARKWAFENVEARGVFRRAFAICDRVWRERG